MYQTRARRFLHRNVRPFRVPDDDAHAICSVSCFFYLFLQFGHLLEETQVDDDAYYDADCHEDESLGEVGELPALRQFVDEQGEECDGDGERNHLVAQVSATEF